MSLLTQTISTTVAIMATVFTGSVGIMLDSRRWCVIAVLLAIAAQAMWLDTRRRWDASGVPVSTADLYSLPVRDSL
jgi:hypothetical protein